ncbi:MAG: fused PTS fructose transporter subunit IIA/HPr protein [Pasteurellaceae bacterium]|nr:fused PTS fructose transporter subunit IIA/HPr protein [Pasteurellaceae bacterium]
MLTLSKKNVQLNANVNNKEQAIALVAQGLIENGYVVPAYATSMQIREQQASTYLANGIAIPHGDLGGREQVKKTGVQIYQFPKGVDWGEGNTAYVVIGIAANSDDHLCLLQHLSRLLNDDTKANLIATTQDLNQFIMLLSGKPSLPSINERLIHLTLDAPNLATLSLVNATTLYELGYVDHDFLQKVRISLPLALAPNIYLLDSSSGNLANGIAIARNQQGMTLISVAMVDQRLQPQLTKLIQPAILHKIANANQAELLAIFNNILESNEHTLNDEVEVIITLRNTHGLHARPSTFFVNIAKKFVAHIQVQNLDAQTSLVDGKSVMEIMTLGVKKGERLRIVARGHDAKLALTQLTQAIEQGLGERETESCGNST